MLRILLLRLNFSFCQLSWNWMLFFILGAYRCCVDIHCCIDIHCVLPGDKFKNEFFMMLEPLANCDSTDQPSTHPIFFMLLMTPSMHLLINMVQLQSHYLIGQNCPDRNCHSAWFTSILLKEVAACHVSTTLIMVIRKMYICTRFSFNDTALLKK